MPRGKWTPPEAGEDAPAEVKHILKVAYAQYRDKHPAENPRTKAKGAKIAWGAVHNAGWKKNAEGKWTKEECSRAEMMDVKAKDFTIFKAGTWNGEKFTESDLDAMAETSRNGEPIPIIVGHSSDYKGHTRIPVFGQITGGLKRMGKELVAMGVQFNDKLAQWIKDGLYPQRSIELTRDNKRVLAVAMIGVVPPAVKGLPGNDEALHEIALQFSQMSEAKTIEFQDASAIDFEALEELAVENTIVNIDQEFATCLADIENHLNADDEDEEIRQNCLDALMECYKNVAEEITEHFTFAGKLEQLEPEETDNMMSKLKEWLGIKSLSQRRKEKEMDAKKEQEYQERIDTLTKTVKEFQDKEAAEAEAKAKAEAEAKEKEEAEAKAKAEAEAKAAEEKMQEEVKQYCDQAVKEGRMTPAMRETDEKHMLTLARFPEALKSFQQKYTATVVPLGEVTQINTNPQPQDITAKAAKYVKDHPKEFADVDVSIRVQRALWLYSNNLIKFEGEK